MCFIRLQKLWIKPWNHLPFKDSFMDTLLLLGVVRPDNVIILTKEQKKLYY